MFSIIATKTMNNCTVTSQSHEKDLSFFEAAINVYDSLDSTCSSNEMLASFCIALVDYIVDLESDWVAGDEAKCDKQEKCLRSAIAVLETIDAFWLRNNAIEKGKKYLNHLGFLLHPSTK